MKVDWNEIITEHRLRLRPHRTIKQCAWEAGVRPEAWGTWEKGTRIPHRENRRRIAMVLQTTAKDIWGEQDNDK